MTLFSILSPQELLMAMAIAFASGWVKGMVGFAMPMILVSGLNSFLPPDLALAGLILPTLVTNGQQALRGGCVAAVASIRRFRVFLVVGGLLLLMSAQLVALIPGSVFLVLMGGFVSVFALLQVLGFRMTLSQPSTAVEAVVGGVAGFVGGMSGVWGPPTVAYLTALNTPKTEQIRIQGVIYGLGAVLLLAAHLGSGILHAETLQFSTALIVPAVAGMWIGMKLQDRIDQASFRKATLLVLLIAGLNLLRRGLVG
ncbi:sulfite exporter TauE/SafE family protein [Ruegeria marisrubri]|uniref:sulfite exporter TauE/SafE family protein n=1 Tax=Ruegeria marisrubri TaxID=1685379 RepID=UPI001CD4D60F|nr:sulfite exporter TauE/SafE family protein [Ruegeria marisrubri]MCA0908346.1 sulfite exporter TauE/SafE family protein [Ruegeria marisrubri]